MAVYICGQCLFCFERTNPEDVCPDCGRMCVRDATTEETAEYRRIRAELNGSKVLEQNERQGS